MKRFISYILIIALASSCNSFLDTTFADQPEQQDVLAQNTTSRRFLANVYNYIPLEEDPVTGAGWVSARSSQALFSWYGLGKYQAFRSGDYSAATVNSDNSYDIWDQMYRGIHQATVFMQDIDLDVQDNQETRTIMKAEARFLRAYFYFCLLRQYGPVYIIGDGLYDQTLDPAAIDRNTLDENIDFIVSELDKAAADLPVSMADCGEGSANWQGRATKGAAMALKARLLTMAASPLYNGCELYKGTMKNLQGNYIFPQQTDQTRWDKAAAACKEVIDLGIYSLCSDDSHDDAFQNAAAAYQKVFFENWNTETIWGWWKRDSDECRSVTFSELGGAGNVIAMQVPRGFGKFGFSGICPSLRLVDSYAMYQSGRYPVTGYQTDADGQDLSHPVIDVQSGYCAEGWVDEFRGKVDTDWAPAFRAHSSTVGREPRFYACIVANGHYWPSSKLENARLTIFDGDDATCRYSTTGEQHPRTGYCWRRNYQANTALERTSDYSNLQAVYPDIRLAEIYLSYAEACNEKPSRDEASALEYLNKVRNRAGLCNIEVAYPEVIGDKALLRTLIRMERRVEFAMEPTSWYDALRWMTAKEECNCANWTLKCSATSLEDSYVRVKDEVALKANIFTDRDYLYPISYTTLKQNVNITQNIGY